MIRQFFTKDKEDNRGVVLQNASGPEIREWIDRVDALANLPNQEG